ncbi:MAG: HTH-type transcriptional regulator Xre [Gammaproteobacteria bacterium]|nr:HTH-type transcriptional regulator Xre [Gammaproteobacteria bacterium]
MSNTKDPQISSFNADIGRGIRCIRTGLNYTQQQMARALGIQAARYSKYEIGRSAAPYDVLVKIAKLGRVTLDFLITGENQEGYRKPTQLLPDLLSAIPVPAVVYDWQNRLVRCNRLFTGILFRGYSDLVSPGMAQEDIQRTWAYVQGHGPLEAEDFVRRRQHHDSEHPFSIELRIGKQALHIAESRRDNHKFVLVTNATNLRGRD